MFPPMEHHIKESGKTIKNMGMVIENRETNRFLQECINMLTERHMKENGKKIKGKEKAKIS